MLKLSDHWRSATTRLILIYGAFFAAWSCVLVGFVYWDTSRYLSRVVDELLAQRAHYLVSVERAHLPAALEATDATDLRGMMALGLFAADGAWLAGNIDHAPAELPSDGVIRALPDGLQRRGGDHHGPARGLAMRLPGGEQLVVARDTRVIDRVSVILRQSLLWGLSLTLIPGLLGGLLLSRGPLRRVRRIEAAIEPITRGDFARRLPVSGRGDEVDLLATIVNRMLAEIERLIGEVKGVSDHLAHDLRTPLTRLRSQLHRLREEAGQGSDPAPALDRCIADTDALLERFRALLRISELEDLRRRSGFDDIELGEILRPVHELYAPLAEDAGIRFGLRCRDGLRVRADAQLLFEAVSNLVANAIKFTPAGGEVRLEADLAADGPHIAVIDSGPGIPAGERDAVLQRFYRGTCGRDCETPGHGLGLSIVSAIVRLHGYRLDVGNADGGGARIAIDCGGGLAAGLPPSQPGGVA